MNDYITLYDSTLRDGSQARGVDFTLADKLAIARALDDFGIDYIEGGWPGANPKDDAFFAECPTPTHAKISAFGMTRRAGRSASNDPGLQALLATGAKHICIVGKSWDFHIEKALEISVEENTRMIAESIQHICTQNVEALFDAEHFFDGYKHNKQVAMDAIRTAYDAGARWVVLCDTNGGTLPYEIADIVQDVIQHIPGAQLGIHCHNDTEQAVANSLAAVQAGVRQVQGTINGIGERCGNANLVSIIPTLMLKMGFRTGVSAQKLQHITSLSRQMDERLNRASNPHAAYVGSAAFAHKGGLHVSAIAKDASSYEHLPPESVGNRRHILVSDKSGRANLVARLAEMGIDTPEDADVSGLLAIIKERETEGYAYEGADASFALLARRHLHNLPDYFDIASFRVLDERRWNAKGELITLSEATIKLYVNNERVMTVGEGNGPVSALDAALRAALLPNYPMLAGMRLTDYKVRILNPQAGTKAITRVMIESTAEDGTSWQTVGVSYNVIDASFLALHDAICYALVQSKVW